jgi:hypothetical protein
MAGIWKNTMKLLTGSDELRMPRMNLKNKLTKRQLIQMESELGGHLFGAVPVGHHRQFFNLDINTWVWYEEWQDEKGRVHSTTTRYELHENGILKVQDHSPYYYIEGNELTNLLAAIQMYYEKITREIYHRDPATGQTVTD